jgi:protein-S-isoprenylcysteine O-methyltransferase Ste14
MDPLSRQALLQGVGGLFFFLALVFGTAGTWDYWQGWVFLAVFAMSTVAFTVYLVRYDKPLLARRLKAGPWHEQERSQTIVVSLILFAFFAFIVVPILDYRHRLSPVPAWVSIVGEAIIVFSYLAIFWVIKTNTWAASNIRVEAGQKVIDSGPYAYVRHPMYAGARLWARPTGSGRPRSGSRSRRSCCGGCGRREDPRARSAAIPNTCKSDVTLILYVW